MTCATDNRRSVIEVGARVRCVLSNMLLATLTAVAFVPALGAVDVRVGVYDNPPKVYVDSAGVARGLFPELVDAIAVKEGWTIHYVAGSWTEGLARLASGDIDLMVDVAYTAPRAEIYAFTNETVLVNWGIVYARKGLHITSLPDLDGLRVAVMRGSTHTVDSGGIIDLAQRFALSCTFVEVDDYSAVFRLLDEGGADAGVVNRIFGLQNEAQHAVERTPILFNPSELRFALPKTGALTPLLAQRIDARLVAMKADSDSAYYQALDRNLGLSEAPRTVVRRPPWLWPSLAAAGALIAALAVSVLVVRHQVRERTSAERALRKSEAYLRALIENMPIDFFIIGTDLRYTMQSPTSKAAVGDVIGLRADEIDVPRDLRDAWMQDLREVLSGHVVQGEYDTPTKAAGMRTYLSTLAPVRVGGEIIAAIGTSMDITGRRTAEEALRKSEAYLRTIIQNMPVDCFSIDRDLRYTLQSPTSVATIGDYVGRRADEIDIPEPMRGHWLGELRRALAGDALQTEYDLLAPDGAVRTYQTNVAPVRVDGIPVAVVGTSIDITARTRAANELQVAKERAEAADKVKSAFLATMSHELRTPLNSILGFTGILLQGLAGPLNEEQQKQLAMVQTSARHLLALINDVLDISKIEAGELKIEKVPFELADLIGEVTAAARPLMEKKGLGLSVEVSPGIGTISSDRRRVGQVLMNLISNAIKFTPSGEVHVRCHRAGDWAVVSVADTGIGINGEDLNKLFMPFQQVESGLTRNYEGTGLGLSISKRLVMMLGGDIAVESEFGRGSTFRFWLPI